GAVAQDDLKRLLSFTLVSHIGYLIFGIALATEHGWAASIYYVAHHITVQTALFLVAGLIERRGGSTSLESLGGLAKAAPVLAILFFIPAMNLAGIPPLSGFLGKIGLMQAGVAVGTPLALALVVGGVVTSLLTLYALIKAWNKAFWQTPPVPLPDTRLPVGMTVPAAALVVLGLALTFGAGPLYGYAERAATALAERTPYIDAVLPDDGRGEGESADVARQAEEEAADAASGTGVAADPTAVPSGDPTGDSSGDPTDDSSGDPTVRGVDQPVGASTEGSDS
ncbi:MAG TPA: proton-conducting transporter membrane subunit, partial [Cellulomonas sp.]